MNLRLFVLLKMTCVLVCQRILLNFSLRLVICGTEMKIFFN